MVVVPGSDGRAGRARPTIGERSSSIFGWNKDGRKEEFGSFQQGERKKKLGSKVFLFFYLLFSLFFMVILLDMRRLGDDFI